MQLTAPDYVVLIVEELDRALRFYTEVLGLEVHRFSDHVIYVKHPALGTFAVTLSPTL